MAELKKLGLEDLMNLQVTSVSRRESTVGDSPAAIHVITGEDIRRSGVTSIPEALRMAPGMEVARIDNSTWAVSARGFNGTLANKLLVLMDGRSVYTPLYGGVFWDVQDTLLDDIDRIEVIRGPAGSLWGANAVNGVINIISKSAKDTQGLLVQGGGGTEELAFGGVRYGVKLSDNAYARVYVKHFERDETVFANGSTNGTGGRDEWQMTRGGFRVDWQPAEINQFTFQGDIYGGTRQNLSTNDADLFGGNVLGRWTHNFAGGSDLTVQTYYDRTERTLPQSSGFKEVRDTFDVDFQHHIPWGERQDLTWGLGYRRTADQVSGSPIVLFSPDERTSDLFSLFVQDEIELVEERLHLTLGSKFEYNDFTGFEVQPNARLLWKITPKQSAWGAVSRAVRTPTRFEDDLIIIGNRNFQSEEVLAFELGYRVEPLHWLALDIATYYNIYDNLLSIETAPAFTFGNTLFGETYGVELGSTWKLADWWTVRAAYTYLEVQLHRESGSTDTSSESGEGNNPHHQVYVRSSMNFPRRVELDCTLRYVAKLPTQSVPSYYAADVRLGWRPTKQLELSVVGQNLLDNQHPEFGTGATRHEIQRGVYGKVTWEF